MSLYQIYVCMQMLWRISATNKQCMSSALTVDFTQITTPSWCHRQICTLLYNFTTWGRYLNARVMWSQLPARIPQGTFYIDCNIASAWQIEILQFCTKPSIFSSQILTAVRTFVFEAVNFLVFFFNICFAFAMSLFETTILSVHPIKHAQCLQRYRLWWYYYQYLVKGVIDSHLFFRVASLGLVQSYDIWWG